MKLLLLTICVILTGCGALNDEDYVSVQSANLKLTTNHGEDGAAWGFSSCDACHPLDAIHLKADVVRDIVRKKGYQTCAGCHGNNGTDIAVLCLICHNETDMPDKPHLSDARSHNFKTGSMGPLGDADCILCHDASDMNGQLELTPDLTLFEDEYGARSNYKGFSEFCLRCHNRDNQQTGFEIGPVAFDDPLVAIKDEYSLIDFHGHIDGSGAGTYSGLLGNYSYQSIVACDDCHQVHGSKNDALIIDNAAFGVSLIHTGPAPLSYTVNTPDGDYSQLCVLCHEMTIPLDQSDLDTGNGLSGVHATGSDCRPCHTHGESVQSGL